MALKQAKKQVGLKASVADNIGIPKFPTTTIAAEISKPISEAIDVFRKKAEVDASANWQFQFNQQSRDHYLQLKDKFKFDPDGMRNAVDNYSKTVIASTPNVYKNIAQNILAQKNLANMSYATTNYNNREDQKALDGWNLTKDQTMVDAGSHLETINMNPNLTGLDINSFIGNDLLKTLNHNYGGAESTIVETNRYSGSQLKKDLDNDIIDLETLRVFSIIKKLGDVDGNKYFLNYAAGKDNLPITPDNVDNPIFQKYAKDITDPFKRSKIITKVKSLYDDYNSKNINQLKNAKIKYNLDGQQASGGILDVHKFANGANGNATNYVTNSMPGIDKDFDRAVEIVNKNINVQELVSKAANYEVIDKFEDNEQMELFKTALLRRYGIDDKNITDIDNPDLATVMELYKNQNIEPTAVLKKINKDYNVNFKTPGMIEDFKENLSLFNYIKSQDMFPYVTVENEHIYNAANKMGLSAMESNEIVAEKLNQIVGNKGNLEENYKKVSDNIDNNLDVAINNMKWTIEMQDINTDTWWLKKIFNKKVNKFSHMFIPESTSAWYKGLDMTPQVQQVWLNNIKTQLAYINGNSDIDITTDEGKQQFYKASIQALHSMNKQGYSATRLNGTGKVSMIKHGFEKEIGFTGQGFDSALMAQANYLKENLSKEEQIERFGFDPVGPSGKEQTPVNITDVMKRVIDENYKNLIIEPTGTFTGEGKDRKPNYHAKILYDDKLISLTQGDNFFDPTGLRSNMLIEKDLIEPVSAPETRNEIMQEIATKKFDLFMKKGLGRFIDGDSGTEKWLQKFFYGTTKTMIEASDYRFYPDFPLINDVPKEVKPFGFIFKALGKDIDVESYYNEAAEINNEVNEIISMDAQINKNRNFTDKQKLLESRFPPHKTSATEAALQKTYMQHVYNSYQDKSLPLTFRTNNYMAVMKTDQTWDGEMTDITTGNQAAIFASPVDSIRAAMRVMINNSTLIKNETTKRYGNNPTAEQILKVYAVDSEPYLNALEDKTNFTRDTAINFYDGNQMYQLIKFMIEHEMGSEAFNEYYPPQNQTLLDKMIFEGYTRGINSYGGKLGKLN
tara:strand:- start:1268 stop:4492 length:3225 start_codon:yes stop_codon:yes gene_type:complete